LERHPCGVPTYGLNKIFPPLYAQAKQRSDFSDGVKEVLATKNYPRDTEFRSRLESSKLYASGERVAKTKLILDRLEESYDHQEPVVLEELTIEHIMPQTLTTEWQSNLGANWETIHELLLHTLGNLTLTGYNAPLSNEPFSRKRTILLNSHLELNRFCENVTEWNEATVRDRAGVLAERSLRVWPYFGAQKDEAPDEIAEVRGRSPSAVIVLGEKHLVHSWRDVAERTFETLIELDEDRFTEIIELFPKFLGRDGSRFRSSRQLSNGVHMLTNLSASSIQRFCIQATQAAGLSLDDWKVEFA
jgi:hypothetical protein